MPAYMLARNRDVIIKMVTVRDFERMERFKKRARLGGLARAKKLSAKRRKEIAKGAARKRWDKITRIDPELTAVVKKYI